MSENDSNEWPSYLSGRKDHLHALGVITSRFNDLESMLFGVFLRHLLLRAETGQRIFALLSNFERIGLIRAELEKEPVGPLEEAIGYFLDCYEIIADNRNLLAHSNLYSADTASTAENAVFGKGSKRQPGAIGYVTMTVPDLRRVADEIQALCNYEGKIHLVWAAKRGMLAGADGRLPVLSIPLPDRPPKPIALKSNRRDIHR